MASVNKADRDKARAESRFRTEIGATTAVAENKQKEVAEREKIARLRALRLAQEKAIDPTPKPQAKKDSVKKIIRRGIGG